MTVLSDVEAALPDEFMFWPDIRLRSCKNMPSDLFKDTLDQLLDEGRAERQNFRFYRRARPQQGAV